MAVDLQDSDHYSRFSGMVIEVNRDGFWLEQYGGARQVFIGFDGADMEFRKGHRVTGVARG